MNMLTLHKSILALLAVATFAVPAVADNTAIGTTINRHKALYFDNNECNSLYVDMTSTSAILGVLRLDGAPRKDGAGDCTPYSLPGGFAFVVTKLSWVTQDASSECNIGSLNLSGGGLTNRLVYKGAGVTSKGVNTCSHEADFGSGLIFLEGDSQFLMSVGAGFLLHVDLQGYLVRP